MIHCHSLARFKFRVSRPTIRVIVTARSLTVYLNLWLRLPSRSESCLKLAVSESSYRLCYLHMIMIMIQVSILLLAEWTPRPSRNHR